MRRSIFQTLVVLFAASVAVLTGSSAPAMAHPLGNFTINHHLGIHVTENTLHLDYVVDMAELPAFAEIREMGDPTAAALHRYSSEACVDLADGLKLILDGEAIQLEVASTDASTPPGNSGVPTLRIECSYQASIGTGTLLIENTNYAERIGWREMVVTSDAVPISTELPSDSPSSRLTAYPEDSLSSVPDVRQAEIVIGQGNVAAGAHSTPASVAALGSLVELETLGLGSGLAAIAAALALGTGHALAPGHGKTVVAAYLVGSKGTARQAVVLAFATAFSHTVGVAILGVIAATATVTFEPATVYPYLSALAGLVVLAIGVKLLWRLRTDREHGHDHHHDDSHHHGIDHQPHIPALSWKSVAALGLSGGLVPSASAVVLLLGAVHIGHAWFGVLLVAAFGIGMSLALIGSGLLAVFAQRWGWHLFGHRHSYGPLGHWIPRVAASVVVALGTIMTVTGLTSISPIG